VRRLARILVNALTVLSLLLFVATVALWVRSHGPADLVWWRRHGTNYQVESIDGGVIVMRIETLIHDPAPGEQMIPPAHATRNGAGGRFFTRLLPAEGGWCQTRGGAFTVPRRTFGFQYAPVGDGSIIRLLRIPHAAFLSVTAFLPIVYFARALRATYRRRSRIGGLCPICGYDLRATPDRCPECGKIPSA
jgi:hypothetical protein